MPSITQQTYINAANGLTVGSAVSADAKSELLDYIANQTIYDVLIPVTAADDTITTSRIVGVSKYASGKITIAVISKGAVSEFEIKSAS